MIDHAAVAEVRANFAKELSLLEARRSRYRVEFVRPDNVPDSGPVGQRITLRREQVYGMANAMEAMLRRHCARPLVTDADRDDAKSVLRVTDAEGHDIEIAMKLEGE